MQMQGMSAAVGVASNKGFNYDGTWLVTAIDASSATSRTIATTLLSSNNPSFQRSVYQLPSHLRQPILSVASKVYHVSERCYGSASHCEVHEPATGSCTTFPDKSSVYRKKVMLPTIYTHNRCNNTTCYLYTSRTNSWYIKISREILAQSSPISRQSSPIARF